MTTDSGFQRTHWKGVEVGRERGPPAGRWGTSRASGDVDLGARPVREEREPQAHARDEGTWEGEAGWAGYSTPSVATPLADSCDEMGKIRAEKMQMAPEAWHTGSQAVV